MIQIGRFSCPQWKVSAMASIAKSIVTEFKGTLSTPSLASHLGMKEGTGGFADKVSALKHYGFLEGRGTLRATSLAEKIAYPREADEDKLAIAEGFLRVALFEQLHKRLGTTLPAEDKFTIIAQEVTGASRADVVKKGRSLFKLYADGITYLQFWEKGAVAKEKGAIPTEKHMEGEGTEEVTILPEPGFARLILSNMSLRVPETPANVDLLIQALTIRKKELEAK